MFKMEKEEQIIMKEECLICRAPLEYLEKDELMECAICHMHGPEHHVMVGAALLTAYKNAGGKIDLEPCLRFQR